MKIHISSISSSSLPLLSSSLSSSDSVESFVSITCLAMASRRRRSSPSVWPMAQLLDKCFKHHLAIYVPPCCRPMKVSLICPSVPQWPLLDSAARFVEALECSLFFTMSEGVIDFSGLFPERPLLQREGVYCQRWHVDPNEWVDSFSNTSK
jgi:hypothetical protein